MIGHDVRPHVAEPARSARHRLDGDRWTGPALGAALVAMALVPGLIYIVIAVTFGINIPLNNELDRAGDPDRIGDLAHVRDRFETSRAE
jgi:hypothetical protein